MFLQGEMPRDSFGGESRDLEPFAQNRAFWARHGHRATGKKSQTAQKVEGNSQESGE
jgi:hypothetical protein